MIEYDRFIPKGGLKKPKREKHPKDPAITDRRMFQIWVVYTRPQDSDAIWVLNGFVHRKYIRPKSLKRLRRKLKVPKDFELRLVNLPCAWTEAKRVLTGAHHRPIDPAFS